MYQMVHLTIVLEDLIMFCSKCDLSLPIPLESNGYNSYQCPRCGMVRTVTAFGNFQDATQEEHQEQVNEAFDSAISVGKTVGKLALGALILGALASKD